MAVSSYLRTQDQIARGVQIGREHSFRPPATAFDKHIRRATSKCLAADPRQLAACPLVYHPYSPVGSACWRPVAEHKLAGRLNSRAVSKHLSSTDPEEKNFRARI
jgi:hypothetical protein